MGTATSHHSAAPIAIGSVRAAGELEVAARQAVMRVLPYRPQDEEAVEELTTQALFTAYFTWLARQVSRRPRQVHVSRELADQRAHLNPDVGEGLSAVLDKAAIGGYLRPHLSTGSSCGFDRRGRSRPGRRRKDLDLLLGAWGLHHFHLSAHIGDDGWAARTDQVLFAAVQADRFYAVAVATHTARHDPLWTVNQDLLPIIARNWPEEDALLRASSLGGRLTSTFSAQDQLLLRQSGVTLLQEVEGRVCLPGAIAVDGTPLAATSRAQRTVLMLEQWERVKGDLAVIAEKQWADAGGSEPLPPTWWVRLTEDGELELVRGDSGE